MIDQLRSLANEIGLHALGVAPATDEVREAYPWARCVLVTAICHLPPESAPSDTLPSGLIAKFAQSTDYHTVLRSKLQILADAMRAQIPGSRLEVCVDTSALPERKLAVLAGVALRGKSGAVFVEGCGSYASLGEIITDIQLPAHASPVDTSFNACGDCNKCMQACPTGAITAPGVVNMAKCVSYLTQSSGVIPRDLRQAIGSRVYGCDTCQQVCPRNAGTKASSPEFAAQVFPGPTPELIPLLRLTPAEYSTTVRSSSIGWIRRTRIRRNAAIAAGNTKSTAALEALIELLSDTNTTLRIHAAWALSQIPSQRAQEALKHAQTREQDPQVIEEITDCLSNK